MIEVAVKVAFALSLIAANGTHAQHDVGHKLPVLHGIPASPVARTPTSPPDLSIGVFGPCAGVTASVPVIECAAEWAGIDAGEFLAVADRESGLDPTVTSRTGCCHGLFQLHETYFAEWARRYTDLRWFGGIVPSYFDPRANALVAAGMWADQGGPCPAWC